MKISRSNRYGLFKLEILSKVNFRQLSVESEYVGFKPISDWIIFQEKPRLLAITVSVLKLTQVGRVRILRRSRELLLRNSAKILRNFGIRSACILF
jgi:hypothetical protein